jgi:hypothetical protein
MLTIPWKKGKQLKYVKSAMIKEPSQWSYRNTMDHKRLLGAIIHQ